jgi:cobalt-precorrin-7 (C5)-methyltransferase
MKPYRVMIVGCGPGAIECLTTEAIRAIDSADILVGAKRLLDLFPDKRSEKIGGAADIQAALDRIEKEHYNSRIAVLVTGDPGLCSLAQPVLKRFGRHKCQVIPGISSIQTAFARIGVDWYDAAIISLHGRQVGEYPKDPGKYDKVAVLMEGTNSLPEVVSIAVRMGENVQVFLCEDLTMDSERIRQVELPDLKSVTLSTRTIVLLIRGYILR